MENYHFTHDNFPEYLFVLTSTLRYASVGQPSSKQPHFLGKASVKADKWFKLGVRNWPVGVRVGRYTRFSSLFCLRVFSKFSYIGGAWIHVGAKQVVFAIDIYHTSE